MPKKPLADPYNPADAIDVACAVAAEIPSDGWADWIGQLLQTFEGYVHSEEEMEAVFAALRAETDRLEAEWHQPSSLTQEQFNNLTQALKPALRAREICPQRQNA